MTDFNTILALIDAFLIVLASTCIGHIAVTVFIEDEWELKRPIGALLGFCIGILLAVYAVL